MYGSRDDAGKKLPLSMPLPAISTTRMVQVKGRKSCLRWRFFGAKSRESVVMSDSGQI